MFNNTVKVEWLDTDPRKMRLLEDIIFRDSNNTQWKAKAGNVIDGASIPKFFWLFIGSPFIGKYRRPSAIHDVYCTSKTLPYLLVHKMFYEAMITDNVPTLKAKAMYYAVRIAGPKW